MHFIFPQNYNFKNKLFGFIDYWTAIVNLIWYFIVFNIFKILSIILKYKIYGFIIFCFPLFLFSFLGFNGENIVYFFYYIFKFLKNKKLYFFNK